MPAVVKTARDERLWDEAKRAALKRRLSKTNRRKSFWRYAMATFLRMKGRRK
jgi:hypothetical protein